MQSRMLSSHTSARNLAPEVALCKTEKHRPVGSWRVTSGVLAKGDVAIHQGRLYRREFSGPHIFLAEQSVNRTGTRGGQEHTFRVYPTIAFGRPGTDKNRARRAESDKLMRIHRQVVPLQRASVFDKVICHPVILVGQCDVLHQLAPIAAMQFHGRRIRETPKSEWLEIVGVVGNEHDNGAHEKAPTIVYWPLLVANFWGRDFNVQHTMSYALRSPRVGTPAFLKEVQTAVWSVNPAIPTANARTLEKIYERSMLRTSFTLLMLMLAGGVALILGVVGIYGVISYAVSQRTREIGIRMALGARRAQVEGLFVRDGLTLIAVGVVLGLAGAACVTRLLTALLFGVSPVDPATYAAVSAGLAAAALLACYLPARRAASVDPVTALRSE